MVTAEEPRRLRPAPVLTQDNEHFWLAAAEGRLVIQRCAGCGRFHHPPRPICPECHSGDQRWHEAAGRGVVYSYALLHHPQHPSFEYPVPAVLVELDEGVRLVSNLVGVEADQVHIGMPVEVAFEPTAGDLAVPVFRPVVSAGPGAALR
jgi:uncharacterized OB-fold protein